MAIEAVRFKRLSKSNFASGWIPLIYDGKELESGAASPEMPWQVNCILSLLTNSKDLQARAHTYTRIFLQDEKLFLLELFNRNVNLP